MAREKDIIVDMSGLFHLKADIENGARQNAGKMRALFKEWAVEYRAEMHERFTTLARSPGSGGWPGYADSTRRSRGDTNKASMLWDTGGLINVLDPKLIRPPGVLNRPIQFGIETGYGGEGMHEPKEKKKKAKKKRKRKSKTRRAISRLIKGPPRARLSVTKTPKIKTSESTSKGEKVISVAALAAIHHFGLGHMPQRKLLVDPSRETMQKIEDLTVATLAEIVRDNQIVDAGGR